MVEFIKGSFYRVSHARRPLWSLLVQYKGFYSMNGHTFTMLAENWGNDNTRTFNRGFDLYCLHEPWFNNYEYIAELVGQEDLPLWVSADCVSSSLEEFLKCS